MSRLIRRIRSGDLEPGAVNSRVIGREQVVRSKIKDRQVTEVKKWPGGPRVRPGDLTAAAVQMIQEQGQAGGTPATVTVFAEGLSVASGDGVDATFDGSLENAARKNLLALNGDGDGVPLPWVGTYFVDIKRTWTLTPSFRGGGAMEVLLDCEVVWPLDPESSSGEPTSGYDLPYLPSQVVVFASSAGQTLSVRPTQTSGEAQTCDLFVSVTLVEPRGLAAASAVVRDYDEVVADVEPLIWYRFDGRTAVENLADPGTRDLEGTIGSASADGIFEGLDAIRFNEDNRIQIPGGDVRPIRAVMVWVKGRLFEGATDAGHILASQYSGGAQSPWFRLTWAVDPDYYVAGYVETSMQIDTQSGPVDIQPLSWYQLLFTWDADGSKLWVNGQLAGTDDGAGDWTYGNGTLWIGGSSSPTFNDPLVEFSGDLAEVVIWRDSLMDRDDLPVELWNAAQSKVTL